MNSNLGLWIVFAAVVITMLVLDLGVLNRKSHSPSFREALGWCLVWVALALLFNAGIWLWRGPEQALLFLTGYLVEESLSIDNLFVFILVFDYFRVKPEHKHRILFWGILGAVVMRALFIAAGVALIHRFHWIIYLFGAFLVFTGFKLLRQKETGHEAETSRFDRNFLVRMVRRLMPVSTEAPGGKFIVRQTGRLMITPLMIVLLVVETTDIIFAVDSIPAILAITTDPFIVYTSNIFAILGLRSLFFVLANFMRRFEFLNYGLAVILVFIGIKMLITDWYHMPAALSLAVIASVLAASVAASLGRARWIPRR